MSMFSLLQVKWRYRHGRDGIGHGTIRGHVAIAGRETQSPEFLFPAETHFFAINIHPRAGTIDFPHGDGRPASDHGSDTNKARAMAPP